MEKTDLIVYEFPSIAEYHPNDHIIHINWWDAENGTWDSEPCSFGWKYLMTCRYKIFWSSEAWREAKRKIKLIDASWRVASLIAQEAYNEWKAQNDLI